jgi:hypothetical protein
MAEGKSRKHPSGGAAKHRQRNAKRSAILAALRVAANSPRRLMAASSAPAGKFADNVG